MRPAHQFLKSAFASPPELARLLRSGPSPRKTTLFEQAIGQLTTRPPAPPALPPQRPISYAEQLLKWQYPPTTDRDGQIAAMQARYPNFLGPVRR